jgi:hypothetical protein
MPEITNSIKHDDEEMEARLREVSPRVSQAIRKLLYALDCDDQVLKDSARAEALDYLVEDAQNAIRNNVEGARWVIGVVNQHLGQIEGVPQSDFDELGKKIESMLDSFIKVLTALTETINDLAENGRTVENGSDLVEALQDLKKLKTNTLQDWPMPGRRPSPIDRPAMADARAALARGEQGMRREEMVWGNDPFKKSG